MKSNKEKGGRVTRPSLGLNQDVSFIDQPKNSTRFVLNGVNESNQGDLGFISNEESNEECASLPQDYIQIGKEYIGNGQTSLFLVKKDETASEIGILDSNCNYTTHVNDELQVDKLGFRISKQIDVTYRLRRGCERTVYFVDDYNKPRLYNYDKPRDFKNNSGDWAIDKFNLFKTYNKIPVFSEFTILETGQIPPGSYNFSVQYLDEDLNPTEWITTSDTIIIYNDGLTSKSFDQIRGSTNRVSNYQDFGVTNKAIKIDFDNLDLNYPFYRVAVIEANNGSGEVSRVVHSKEISTSNSKFVYSGSNAFTLGTVEEIQTFNNVIESARHIEQIENRLVLGDTKGKDISWCKLQKYASRIKANLVTENIVLNSINTENNSKRPTVHVEKIGYMPGEIYSFGIVYVFEDGTSSPVFHIPGRASNYASEMSIDNNLETTSYIDSNDCGETDYWGVDSQGNSLSGTSVRHHRFPLRSEVNKPLFIKDEDSTVLTTNYLYLDISGVIAAAFPDDTVTYTINYTIDGTPFAETNTLDLLTYDDVLGDPNILIASSLGVLAFVSVTETSGASQVDPATNTELIYTSRLVSLSSNIDDSIYRSEMFGITFDSIDIPSPSDIGGETVLGYYIVRQDRDEDNKTILDTGVIVPLIEEKSGVNKFVAYGHNMPKTADKKLDVFGLIHPEHKFRNKEYKSTTEYIQEGTFDYVSGDFVSGKIQDVQPGTSYDSSINKKRDSDSDGFDLNIHIRHNKLDYTADSKLLADSSEIVETFYLNSLFSKSIEDTDSNKKEIYNLSADNKIGIIQLNKKLPYADVTNKLPYVVMKRTLSDPYSGFRSTPYYKETDNINLFVSPTNNSLSIYNGDSYIAPMKYTSSMMYDVSLASRRTKSGVLNYIIATLSFLLAALIIAGTVGLGTGVAIAAIGFGVSQVATGIEKGQMAKVYQELYEQGLKDTVDDFDTNAYFNVAHDDDEIQWFHDILDTVWFETSINTNWRMGNTVGLTDFLNGPAAFNREQAFSYMTEKLTGIDSEAGGGRTYQGYAKAEIYELNLDYARRDREKLFYHLGIEYDCCSECVESFPHRATYSEQSFQEELSDNYRTFLPNNYIDIEGETGAITNMFRIQNNLYIHTEEALWHLPQNIQERITGDIVSFIGTGSFFSIPPRKVLDDETGNSAGTQHKWSMTKTPHGVYFVCESQGTIYKFNGNNLEPTSSEGLFSWFKNNITINFDKKYLKDNQRLYPYRDNPSNPFGTGFISTYDSKKERVIFTKIDRMFDESFVKENYELVYKNGQLYIWDNYNTIIAEQLELGWYFTGITNYQMVFEKQDTMNVWVNMYNPDTDTSQYEFIPVLTTFYSYINPTPLDTSFYNASWTISNSIKFNGWVSWHSYLPYAYINTPDKFYSLIQEDNKIWKHNREGHYQNFYGVRKPFIVEYVSLNNPLTSGVWDNILLQTEAKRYDSNFDDFVDERFITFNKGLFYNNTQCTGEQEFIFKDVDTLNNLDIDYMNNQIKDLNGNSITIDRNERDWRLNELRDMRVDYTQPIFTKRIQDLQGEYFIDKKLNVGSIDYNKDWSQLQSMRDKFLVVRFKFDTFDNIKLILNYSEENENPSFR
tara:strand:- start:2585 stop:7384 length:4800 start_codon:yes stop_codon:yes gene_type:complete